MTEENLSRIEKELLRDVVGDSTDALLDERETTHGKYSNTSRYIQRLKSVALAAYADRYKANRPALSDQQRESLEMILHKVGRILSGDPNTQDHWDDIAGYAKLANKEF